MNRREVLTRSLFGAALAGTGLGILETRAEASGAAAPGEHPSVVGKLMALAYQDGRYALPPLPYAYDALEPHISERIMRLHHDVHHQGYVRGLNNTLQALAELRQGEIDRTKLYALQRDLSFNGGGHTLHTLFWATMSPRGGGTPEGAIGQAIDRQFGSFQSFKNYYTAVATSVKSAGWAVLAYEPVGDMLDVLQVADHDMKLIATTEPLLPLDVWEHAYYLQYPAKRAEYVAAWWNVVNWPAVNAAYTWIRSRFREEAG